MVLSGQLCKGGKGKRLRDDGRGEGEEGEVGEERQYQHRWEWCAFESFSLAFCTRGFGGVNAKLLSSPLSPTPSESSNVHKSSPALKL